MLTTALILSDAYIAFCCTVLIFLILSKIFKRKIFLKILINGKLCVSALCTIQIDSTTSLYVQTKVKQMLKASI